MLPFIKTDSVFDFFSFNSEPNLTKPFILVVSAQTFAQLSNANKLIANKLTLAITNRIIFINIKWLFYLRKCE